MGGWPYGQQQNAARSAAELSYQRENGIGGERENDERKRAPDDGRQALSTDPSIDPQ